MSDVAVAPRRTTGGLPPPGPDLIRHPAVLPIAAGAVFVVSLFLVILRLDQLAGWGQATADLGEALVLGPCQPEGGFGEEHWRCPSRLMSTDGAELVVVAPRSGVAAHRPHVGEQLAVFGVRGRSELAYPQEGQMIEVVRLYFSLLARSLIAAGAGFWLLGWLAGLQGAAAEGRLAFSERWRDKASGWQSQATRWVVVGLLVATANIVVLERIIGSLDIY